ncbi:tumor-associated calcium signal transducer 2-like [Colossoma macropomum]|uniref:tumor-associated calcium signal transducer 2-like n=1 Tax=Colossoma macropomum TaxID=42526 RepID=UPI001863D09B|nr:tumor-associated calcium signal transducer 2-like [Colossoma macropomum]
MTSLGVLLLFLLSFVRSLHACSCASLNWATCDESSCECYINVGERQRQILNCSTSTLIPKCFLMKAAMYRLKHPSSSQNKPTETALADELYDPECEPSGLFKAKQCNNTDVCWCVDSAGVRRSDKGDRNLKCEELVETNAIASVIQEQYKTDQQLDSKIKVKYNVDARLIILDVKDDAGDWDQDLSELAYYMEEDVKVQPLLDDQMKLEPTVVDQQMEMENVLVYYKGEKAPTGDMRRLTVGILTVTVVIILTILVGLLILFLIRRQKQGKYEKAQTSEIEEI